MARGWPRSTALQASSRDLYAEQRTTKENDPPMGWPICYEKSGVCVDDKAMPFCYATVGRKRNRNYSPLPKRGGNHHGSSLSGGGWQGCISSYEQSSISQMS